ncbi:MAG: hypothetical protein KGI25_04320 [Thaumarchaeota archaeon]|nr:hypothetical protein [Nitrososphaerota archaeon]
MRCKGTCNRFAAKKPLDGFRFLAGQRLCSVCGIFIDVNLHPFQRCPCCNNKLRLNSRNSKSRKNGLNLLYKSIMRIMKKQKNNEVILPTLK